MSGVEVRKNMERQVDVETNANPAARETGLAPLPSLADRFGFFVRTARDRVLGVGDSAISGGEVLVIGDEVVDDELKELIYLTEKEALGEIMSFGRESPRKRSEDEVAVIGLKPRVASLYSEAASRLSREQGLSGFLIMRYSLTNKGGGYNEDAFSSLAAGIGSTDPNCRARRIELMGLIEADPEKNYAFLVNGACEPDLSALELVNNVRELLKKDFRAIQRGKPPKSFTVNPDNWT
jgi:hypothetical protein